MEPLKAFRCMNGDYLLVPASRTTPASAGADDGSLFLLGTVTCRHLDEAVRGSIGLQIEGQGFARISREEFFSP